jgi:DNA adenine methylase
MRLDDFFPEIRKVKRVYPLKISSGRVNRPPIKIMGIKIRLIPFILKNVRWNNEGSWVEPFVGSATVLFNVMPDHAIASDINPHVINFYNAIKSGDLTPASAKSYLMVEGKKLRKKGNSYYYEARDKFNDNPSPLRFLFLNRTGFNGLVRFNREGNLNAPFCNEPGKLSVELVSKITAQIDWVRNIIQWKDYDFRCQDFRETLNDASSKDYVYLDPPYSSLNVNYYDRWDDEGDKSLVNFIDRSKAPVMLSTWKKNEKGENPFFKVVSSLDGVKIKLKMHSYRVGAIADWRNEVEEALVIKDNY